MPSKSLPKAFAEYFAGIGLVHEGLRPSGWDCSYANDIDEKKASMYRGHFGDSEYFHLGDIWDTDSIVDRLQQSPFLATASFPCTDLSLAGHWKGIEGEHSSAYFAFIDVLKSLGNSRPKMVMLENVYGFLTSNSGKDFELAIRALAELGYWIDAIVLDAKYFVPQSRPRVFVFGFHSSIRTSRLIKRQDIPVFGDPWHGALEESGMLRPNRLKELMHKIELPTGWATTQMSQPEQAEYELSSFIDTDDGQEWWGDVQQKKHYDMLSDLHKNDVDKRIAGGGSHIATVYRRSRYGKMRAEVRFDNIAGCLRTPKGGSARQIVLVINDGQYQFRWMSPREYARLQGAPDFKLAENTLQSLFGFGDAVCVPAITWIDKKILSPVFADHCSESGACLSGSSDCEIVQI